MYNLPFLQVQKKRSGSVSGASSSGKKQKKTALRTADNDDLSGIRKPAGGATGAAGKRPAAAGKQGRATEEELALLSDLKETRKLVKTTHTSMTAKVATTIKVICINTY
jgi:hypothetical protein